MKHSTEIGYRMEFQETKILATTSGYMDMGRLVMEAVEMSTVDEINSQEDCKSKQRAER
jgi:hypothetical protein